MLKSKNTGGGGVYKIITDKHGLTLISIPSQFCLVSWLNLYHCLTGTSECMYAQTFFSSHCFLLYLLPSGLLKMHI